MSDGRQMVVILNTSAAVPTYHAVGVGGDTKCGRRCLDISWTAHLRRLHAGAFGKPCRACFPPQAHR